MRPIVVTGGRDFKDRVFVDAILTEISPTFVIQGGATGLDSLAGQWAQAHGIHCAQVNALWDSYGRSAGHKRNRVMAKLALAIGAELIAFPGGRGTANMVKTCQELGIPVTVVTPDT